MSTGHADYPPRATPEGSSNVFVEGSGVHRVGDTWTTHCNGKPVARIGDPISCGDKIATGKEMVNVGG